MQNEKTADVLSEDKNAHHMPELHMPALNKNALPKSTLVRRLDQIFLLAGFAILVLFTTRYQMPFRLDDVLHIDWARTHTFFGAWDPVNGQIVRSFRPIFAATIWILSHTAGTSNYFPWHLTLVGSFLVGLTFAGLTARYISQRNAALYFTVALYWLAFLPILNVLFWYGDLTYTIELMFITPAWYFGLRGLLEGRLGFIVSGILCGIVAVMAKEPAIVLVHSVLLGTCVLRFSEIRKVWREKNIAQKLLPILLYALFIAITSWIYLASPTRANRFYSLNTPSALMIGNVYERQSYYQSIFLTFVPRILIFLPIVSTALTTIMTRLRPDSSRTWRFMLPLVIAFAWLSLPFAGSFPVIVVTLALSLGAVASLHSTERRAALLLIPFALSGIITMAALSITIMVVKTQLTELAIVLLVISGWGWSRVAQDLREVLQPLMRIRWISRTILVVSGMLILGTVAMSYPKIAHQEGLLANLRDVRTNNNDAIKWMALHLPPNATLLMPDYNLYGIANSDALTRFSDSVKIHSQYTFHNGYVFIYLNLLGRPDIHPVFLEDSTSVRYELDSARALPAAYLFLQSELDYNRFHGIGGSAALLKASYSLVGKFYIGGFHSEVWRLR